MSDLDALLARSRAPGRAVERRRFTLAREQAVEKLRAFSMRRPEQYVLALVQAATWAGAACVAVDAQPWRVVVAFIGGAPLREEELAGLFDYLFADREDPRNRHLIQLAVGLNALLQRRPRTLRVESGDGTAEGSVRVDLDARGGRVSAPERPVQGTYVLAEFGGEWLARLRETAPPELGLIEERCIYTPVPILLNGKAPFGYAQSRQVRLFGVDRQLPFDTGDRWGAVGVTGARTTSQGFRIVMGGVWVTSLDLPELGEAPMPTWEDEAVLRPLTGVICDDALRRTADWDGVVRDGRYGQMLSAVQPVVERLIHGASERGAPGAPEGALETLGPRARISLDELAALPPDAPLFWVEAAHAAWLAPAADPLDFPHRILVLELPAAGAEGAHTQLARAGLTLHRLGRPEDVAFIRRALAPPDRDREGAEVSVDVFLEPVEGLRLDGKLTLTVRQDGRRPDWANRVEQVPALVRVGGTTEWCGGLPLDLPGVSAVVRAHRWEGGFDRALLASQIAREAWRLLDALWPAGQEIAHSPVTRALALRVLAGAARPRFVRRGDEIALRPGLPARWGEAAGRASGWPVGRTSEGTKTLADLVALQGTERRAALLDDGPAHCVALEALEARFGFGHLEHPELPPWICALGLRGERWRWLEREPAGPEPEAMVWLSPVFAPEIPSGWRALPAPSAICGAAAPADPEGEALDLEPAWRMLRLRLERLARGGDWRELAAPGLSSARIEALARLCRIALSGEVVGAATLDEIRASGTSPLQLDDDLAVWESLADPASPGWLLREPVEVPGLRGWLGLRCPYDATGGLLARVEEETVVLPPRPEPVHGLLHAAAAPTPAQLQLVGLSLRRLYQGLRPLKKDPDPERRDAAERYLADWADARAAETPPELAPDPGLRPRLAVGVEALCPSLRFLLEIHSRGRGPAAALAGDEPAIVEINADHPLAHRALLAPGPAREILLLEIARLLADHAESIGARLDLPELQRYLCAGRRG